MHRSHGTLASHSALGLWYAHASVTVVLLMQLPDELPAGFDRSRT